MSISILGSGAFGTALAISLAKTGQPITLWARNTEHAKAMQDRRENSLRLAGETFPTSLIATDKIGLAAKSDTLLIATPMQQLASFSQKYADLLKPKMLVACCKGVDLNTGFGPIATLSDISKYPAILTGPSFAADIAKGLPTALTLACQNDELGKELQANLSTENLRLYRTVDTVGAELGGALKNVIAIACGITIGANLGESARAAVMTRGYAEMQRLALQLGAHPETLSGLSGFGDMSLTCTSTQSRNYSYGISISSGVSFGENITVEGAATAVAVSKLADTHKINMPITKLVTATIKQKITVAEAVKTLLARPLGKE